MPVTRSKPGLARGDSFALAHAPAERSQDESAQHSKQLVDCSCYLCERYKEQKSQQEALKRAIHGCSTKLKRVQAQCQRDAHCFSTAEQQRELQIKLWEAGAVQPAQSFLARLRSGQGCSRKFDSFGLSLQCFRAATVRPEQYSRQLCLPEQIYITQCNSCSLTLRQTTCLAPV